MTDMKKKRSKKQLKKRKKNASLKKKPAASISAKSKSETTSKPKPKPSSRFSTSSSTSSDHEDEDEEAVKPKSKKELEAKKKAAKPAISEASLRVLLNYSIDNAGAASLKRLFASLPADRVTQLFHAATMNFSTDSLQTMRDQFQQAGLIQRGQMLVFCVFG